jgi:hypothetical protein
MKHDTESTSDILKSVETPAIEALQFVEINDYPAFNVEYTMVDGDLVFHFFRSPRINSDNTFWHSTFPNALSPIAESHFNATAPRLRAEFVNEMDSWWLRAKGYDNILDKDAYVRRFFSKLSQQLVTAMST